MNQLYKEISKQTISRIIEVENAEEFDLRNVKKGIVSVHSKWSGQSIIYGNSILRLIDTIDNDDYKIFIIDIDTITLKKQIDLTGKVCNGYFESVWIENGKIEFNYVDNNKATEIPKFKKFLYEKTKTTGNMGYN